MVGEGIDLFVAVDGVKIKRDGNRWALLEPGSGQ
jgi:hypothetical protein